MMVRSLDGEVVELQQQMWKTTYERHHKKTVNNELLLCNVISIKGENRKHK